MNLAEPFVVEVPRTVLDDLRARLARTRWPEYVEDSGWTYGLDTGYARELVEYWLYEYDWAKELPSFTDSPHFKVEVDGVGIHYVHEKSGRRGAVGLLLLHGFPDSFYRYHKVIDRLAHPERFGGDPNDGVDVVVPSIPGSGFSDRISLDRFGNASVLTKLMTEVLGYSRFIVAGGDHGAIIAQAMARKHEQSLVAMHLTDVGYPDQNTDFSILTPLEVEMAQWVQRWFMEEGIGVTTIMQTKPLTLAYGLNDSPVGLLSWITSFASGGAKGRDEYKGRFPHNEVLTNVMIYWATQTIYTAARAYYDNAHVQDASESERPIVPCAVAHCPYDPPLPREWAERRVNLVRYTEFPRGGHFMAWEEPELYAADVLEFIREFVERPARK